MVPPAKNIIYWSDQPAECGLEALFRKLKSLEDAPKGALAGKMGLVIDLVTRLPVEIWFKENPRTSDLKFEEDILNLVSAKTLLLLDRGFSHFHFWQQLLDQGVHSYYRIEKGSFLSSQKKFSQIAMLSARREADLFEIAWFGWGMARIKRPLSLSYELKFEWGK